MTSQSENDLLTNVGPGTPMGALMRQYRLPACLSSELAVDGHPLRLMLPGEATLVDNPEASTIARSGDLVVPASKRWLEAYEQTLTQALHLGFAEAAE